VTGVTPSTILNQIWHTVIFYLFSPLKDPLNGNHFRSEKEEKEVVHDWMAQQTKDFFSQGIYTLVECWRCAELCGLTVLYIFLQ
jgi:hypothetical protein